MYKTLSLQGEQYIVILYNDLCEYVQNSTTNILLSCEYVQNIVSTRWQYIVIL